MSTNEQIEKLEWAEGTARGITRDAKYLCYPILDIKVKLSSLAEEHGLEDEMEAYLDVVSEIANDLEGAFYACEDVFKDKLREIELEEELGEEA